MQALTADVLVITPDVVDAPSAPRAPATFGDPCPQPMSDGSACRHRVTVLAHYNEGTAPMCSGHKASSFFMRHDGQGGLERYEPRYESAPAGIS